MKHVSLLLACAIALVACESTPSGPDAEAVPLAPSLARIRVDQTFDVVPFTVQNVCEPEPVVVQGRGRIIQRGEVTDRGTRLATLIVLTGTGIGTLTEADYEFDQVETQTFVQTNDPFRAEGENLTALKLDRQESREDLFLLTRLTFVCTSPTECDMNVTVLKSECGGRRNRG